MINQTFTAIIGADTGKSDWTCVVWPESVEVLGTGRATKITGTVDGYPVQTSFLPTGKGTHMLPLNKTILKAINKQLGDEVTVFIKDTVSK